MAQTMILTDRPDGVPAAGVTFGVIAALIWGAWPVVSRLGVDETLNAMDIAALRFGIAGLVLLPVVLRLPAAWPGLWRSLLLSVGAGAPYVLIMVGGLSFAPAGHAGVITPSCMLVFSALGSRLILGEQMPVMRLLGLSVIVFGIALTGWKGVGALSSETLLGDAMFVAGGLLWAGYTVSSRAWGVDPLHATALVSVISMISFLPVYGLVAGPRLMSAPLDELVFQGVFQGIFAAIVALLCYTRSVAILGAGRGAVFAALVPGISVMLAFPILGEQPTAPEMAGVVIVTMGMGAALGLFGNLGVSFRRAG